MEHFEIVSDKKGREERLMQLREEFLADEEKIVELRRARLSDEKGVRVREQVEGSRRWLDVLANAEEFLGLTEKEEEELEELMVRFYEGKLRGPGAEEDIQKVVEWAMRYEEKRRELNQ